MAFNKETGEYEGFIYLLTNKVNNKKYVGQTTTTIKHRMGQYFSNKKLSKMRVIDFAIKKYGKDNFDIKEIKKVSSKTKEELKEILNNEEIYYIKNLHSLVSEHGYNIDKGGGNCTYFSKPIDVYDLNTKQLIKSFDGMSEASRYYDIDVGIIANMCKGNQQRIKDCDLIFRYKGDAFDKYDTTYIIGGAKAVYKFSIKGEYISSYRSLVDAEKDSNLNHKYAKSGIISDSIKNNKTAYGYVWSFDKNFRFDASNYRNWTAVDKYSLDGELLGSYDSMIEGARSVGKDMKNVTNISSVCNGKTLTAFGYVWRYKGEPFDKKPSKRIYTNNRPVDQYTRDGVFISSYDSAKIAGISIGEKTWTSITSCCKGRIKSAFNYVWRYKGEPFDKFNSALYRQKMINQYTTDDKFVKTYSSSIEANNAIGVTYYGSIDKCCKKKIKTFKGFKWFYADDPNQPDKSKIITNNLA